MEKLLYYVSKGSDIWSRLQWKSVFTKRFWKTECMKNTFIKTMDCSENLKYDIFHKESCLYELTVLDKQ